MTDHLRAIARSHGISTGYKAEDGEPQEISDEAVVALSGVLGFDPTNEGDFASAQHTPTGSCFLPDGLREWGITCQLYALRSTRSLGIGDFEDLAVLGEIAGAAGASFVGVNPLHALFSANPSHYSPYSPSTRRFLNPLAIAVDRLKEGQAATDALRASEPDLFSALESELVDYSGAGALKIRLLRTLFDKATTDDAFELFRTEGDAALRNFALFEAISAASVSKGGGAGWHGWDEAFRDHESLAVVEFARENEDEIRFYQWLQYIADGQLGEAQRRVQAAGMRIGLYLDFAVGVSPDGADTWTDPELTVAGARVGSPPDLFNSEGQDWGLAPLSPRTLGERDYKPLREAYAALMKNAGAIRIDHAMGLARLWWIPQSSGSSGGGYVRYPLGAMVDAVAKASQTQRCIVVGEDLGTVPENFREDVADAAILSYRVLYFERTEAGFVSPTDYPERSLACISTHDLATLGGWWAGDDIRLRADTGRQSAKATTRDLAARERDKVELTRALAAAHLAPPELLAAVSAGETLPHKLDEHLAVAIHRFVARSASMLFAVQLDDILGAARQANLPGTTNEYPNWRIKSEILLEDLADDPRFEAFARAMREERPETR